MKIECFSCAGGMALGFRQAGIEFDYAFDFTKEHCDSYEANLGHRPVCMDVRDLLRMAKGGLVRGPVRLFVADPPCTPWSRAGLRQGTEDERDMIEDTCELIRILRPEAYLIGNVPGLDDSKNWHVVQRVIGGLQKYGYCVADFAALDAADYGTPQHRIRPFWYGHLSGPCIRWPQPTHCDPDRLTTGTLPGFEVLKAWVTVRQAIEHLPDEEKGRPVKLRKRDCNSKQHGSVPDKPARVVGTSNLSDGNVLLFNDRHPPADPDKPSPSVTAKARGPGGQLVAARKLTRHDNPERTNEIDAPARAVTSQTQWGNGAIIVTSKHPALALDKPSTTVRGGGDKGHSAPPLVLKIEDHVHEIGDDGRCTKCTKPAPDLVYRVRGDDTKHPPMDLDEPANVISGSDGGGSKRAVRTGKRRARDEGRPGQGMRVGGVDTPSKTLTSKEARVGAGEAHVIKWPWDRPSTVIQADNRVSPPGHHDENFNGGLMSQESAVVISEKVAIILQGFPEDWKICGDTQKIRWSQIGQAMPPQLSRAVATSVAEQMRRTDELAADPESKPNHPESSLATGKLHVL